MKDKPDIIMISETKLDNSWIALLNRRPSIYSKDRNDEGDGIILSYERIYNRVWIKRIATGSIFPLSQCQKMSFYYFL